MAFETAIPYYRADLFNGLLVFNALSLYCEKKYFHVSNKLLDTRF